jgi:cyanophycinase-like exopeptidase
MLTACASGGDDAPTSGVAISPAPVDRSLPAPNTRAQAVFFPRFGNPLDDTHGSLGPGVVLTNDGLGPPAAAAWIHDTVDPGRVAGDVVVLTTRGVDSYAEALYAAAPFNSVQTVLLPPGSPAGDIALVADRLATAEVVFLTDGDRANYTSWANGPIAAAVQDVYARGGVVVGAGAGAAGIGAAVFVPLGPSEVQSSVALADPYSASIGLGSGPFRLPVAATWVVEVNTRTEDRLGVLAAMTARAGVDGIIGGSYGLGIGLDGMSALAIDRRGLATFLQDGADPSEDCWIVHGAAAQRIARGEPLLWSSAEVTRFDAPGETLQLPGGCGTAFSYTVDIDGSQRESFVPSDPYDAPGVSAPCTP